jgi:MoaA/NifB/PqqE/SkfB family radical SAM enzyme
MAHAKERRERLQREHPQQGADALAAAPPVEESRKQCGAGSATITVDPYGNVYPCVQWRRHVGNLHESSIIDLWRNSGVLGEVRQLTAAARDAMLRNVLSGYRRDRDRRSYARLSGRAHAARPATARGEFLDVRHPPQEAGWRKSRVK